MSSLFTIINVFANFLILSDALLFEYFRSEGKIVELDFANRFNNVTSFCVIAVAGFCEWS